MTDRKKKNVIGLLIFFGITFGIDFALGIPMYINHSPSPDVYGYFMMLLPVNGALLAQYYRKREKSDVMILFLIWMLLTMTFLVVSTLSGSTSLFGFELTEELMENYCTIISIGLLIYLLIKKKVHIFENGESVHKDILLFIGILLIRNLIAGYSEIINGNMDVLMNAVFSVFGIVSVFLAVVMYFCEEYGWRVYLQDKLQRRFGKRAGVVILGILWCCWHLLWWSANTGINSILEVFFVGLPVAIGCSAFFGYIYIKTKNVWLCAIGHGIYNTMGTGMPDNNMYNIMTVVTGIVLCLFLFKKEYRADV